jgi:hypothetical protein
MHSVHTRLQALDAARAELFDGILADAALYGVSEAALTAPLQALPGLQGLFLTGYTLLDRFSEPPEWRNYLRNASVPPVLFENGADDQLANTTAGTFARLPAPKAAVLLKDLNHFSVADRAWLVRPEPPSPLSQKAQVQRVTDTAITWFDALLAKQQRGWDAWLALLSRDASRIARLLPAVKRWLADFAL